MCGGCCCWRLLIELSLHYSIKDSLHVTILLALVRLVNEYGEISILFSILLTESQPLRQGLGFPLLRLRPMPSMRPLNQTLRKLRVVVKGTSLSLAELMQIVVHDLIKVYRSALS